MDDLDTRIQKLSERDRVSLIQELVRMADQMDARVRAGRRAKRDSVARRLADNARAQGAHLARIIFFLRRRIPATGATAEDQRLCDMLAEKLEAKGQWVGEYSK
jgi:hypothetical protein